MDDYVSYTMRLVEPLDESYSYSNIVIQERDGVEEIFTIRYKVDDNTRTTGSGNMKPGIIPYDGWDDAGDDNTGGGNDDFVEVCRDVLFLEPRDCGCGHMPDRFDECDGCYGNYPSYELGTRQECYMDYTGGNGNTGGTGDNNDPGNTGGGTNQNPPDPEDPDVVTTPISSVLPDGALLTIAECITPDQDQLSWINEEQASQNGSPELTSIWSYINDNGCDDESEAFLEEAINVLIDDGKVDFGKLIVYQPSFEGTETKCIHDKLITDESNNFYKLMASSFSGGDELLNYKIASLPVGVGGETQGHIANNSPYGGFDFYQITISSNTENLSNLVQMVTLSHELIHAFMFNSLDDMGIITYTQDGRVEFRNEQCN